jgi:hypothetical protein
MASRMDGGMSGQMQGGTASRMPGGMAGRMPGGMAGGMQGGMAGRMQGGMQGGMAGGMQGSGTRGCGRFGCGREGKLCIACKARAGLAKFGRDANAGCGNGTCGNCASCRQKARPYAGEIPHTAQTPGMTGQIPQYIYPYYTTRGPRDFLMANPPTIGY